MIRSPAAPRQVEAREKGGGPKDAAQLTHYVTRGKPVNFDDTLTPTALGAWSKHHPADAMFLFTGQLLCFCGSEEAA
eukprot:2092917-Pyramimonas_sp.AAC.1